MKNKDILLLAQELPKITVPNQNRWFSYALVETIERAIATGATIRKVISPKEGMVEYQTKLKELQEKHADKDDYGKPTVDVVTIGNGQKQESYRIPSANDPKSKFSIAAEKLDKKYEKEIAEFNDGLNFIDEENKSFEPYWVTMDQVPDGLSTAEFRIIFLMLEKPTAKA